MTFFLGMNYKFSLCIFQLFPKSPPILGKFDLKHQFTSIFTKIFPIYLQDFQIFPLSKPLEMLWPFFFERILINFPHFHQKWINFSSPPATTSLNYIHPWLIVIRCSSYNQVSYLFGNPMDKTLRVWGQNPHSLRILSLLMKNFGSLDQPSNPVFNLMNISLRPAFILRGNAH